MSFLSVSVMWWCTLLVVWAIVRAKRLCGDTPPDIFSAGVVMIWANIAIYYMSRIIPVVASFVASSDYSSLTIEEQWHATWILQTQIKPFGLAMLISAVIPYTRPVVTMVRMRQGGFERIRCIMILFADAAILFYIVWLLRHGLTMTGEN